MDDSENTELNFCYNCMERLDSGQMVCPVCGYDNSMNHNPIDALPEGSILAGKYVVGKVLGQGGYGITYLGYDTALKKRVAIKEYYPRGVCIRNTGTGQVTGAASLSHPEDFRSGMEEFGKEAEILAQISSPNIVRVLNTFRENGTAYIVMEYANGNSLTEEVRERGGRLPWQRVMGLFRDLIRELGKLHEKHLIHRDIKPDNLRIMKDENGEERLVLLDFGTARGFESAEVSQTYTAMLTPGYAPAEQYLQKGRQGPYTDIYALCASMYAAITGKVPPPSLDRSLEKTELETIKGQVPDVPERVENAILHGLEVSREDRPQSMGELYAELYEDEAKPAAADPDELIYLAGVKRMESDTPEGYQQALALFGQIPGYKDTDSLAEACRQKIVPDAPAPKAANAANAVRPVKKTRFIIPAVVLAAAVILLISVLSGRRASVPAGTAAADPAKAALDQTHEALAATQQAFEVSETEAVLRETQMAMAMMQTDSAAAKTQAAKPAATAAAVPSVTAFPVPTKTSTQKPTLSPGALFDLGKAAYDKGDYAKALECLLPAAEAGHAGAQHDLGVMYQNGYGVERSYKEAVKWYQLAANQGYAAAQYNLGWMYENGKGVEQSYGEAVKWYQLAADQGNAYAQYELGYMYYNGYGVAQSYKEAVKWYHLAADQGNVTAQNNLGYMYEQGYGVAQSYEEAVKWYHLAADQGHARAQGNLGWMYRNGYGVAQSNEEAVKWYQLAANQGYARAQNNLGVMYSNGYGVEQSYEEAVKWYQLAADQGESYAQNNLGWMYENGYGVERSYAEALRWYQMSADQGNTLAQNNLKNLLEEHPELQTSIGKTAAPTATAVPRAKVTSTATPKPTAKPTSTPKPTAKPTSTPQPTLSPRALFLLGDAAYDNGDYAKAFEYLRPAAEAGYDSAQNLLGMMYFLGRGVGQSYEEAFRWFQMAAKQGDATIQANLGYMYENGYGVKQSYEEALKWYRLSADQGFMDAQNDLGDMYYYGRGVERSYEEALKWYQLAAAQGNAKAQDNLGWMYQNGYGVAQSYEEALKWYRLSADQGLASAQFSLGLMYENGYGVSQSYEEAVKWYRLSADQGYASAQFNLGWLYHEGYGVGQSDKEAVKWYQLAADQGYSHAQNNLGWMYENGKGVGQSYEEAVKWYKLAADQENEVAQSNLENLLGQHPELNKVVENMPAGTATPVPTATTAPDARIIKVVPGMKISDLKAGDIIILGQYEQDGNTRNGAEAIEWQVLAVENGRALVISRYSLDTMPYNKENQNMTWAASTLRAWLNGEFYNSAFSKDDKGRIRQATLKNPDNTATGTDGGNDTVDRIFLLTIDEAKRYFAGDEARKSLPTAYAVNRGADVDKDSGTVWWWLRTPGSSPKNAAGVNSGGVIRDGGGNVSYGSGTVRPAFWLDL